MDRPCPCRISPAFLVRRPAHSHESTAEEFCKARHGTNFLRRSSTFHQCLVHRPSTWTAAISSPTSADVFGASPPRDLKLSGWMKSQEVLKKNKETLAKYFLKLSHNMQRIYRCRASQRRDFPNLRHLDWASAVSPSFSALSFHVSIVFAWSWCLCCRVSGGKRMDKD